MKNKIRSLAAVACAAAVAAVSVPAPAQAQEGNAVVIGDSISANPTPIPYVASKLHKAIPQLRAVSNPNAGDCASDNRFASSYEYASGRHVDNYSCAGASLGSGGDHIWDLMDRAHAQGDLNGGTAEVVIQAGFNDALAVFSDITRDNRDIEDVVYTHLVAAINHARELAPNARIKVVGYTTFTEPNTRMACAVNVIPNVPGGRVPFWTFEDPIQWGAVRATHDTGATFVDSKPISTGHDLCSNDRWMIGLVDTTAPDHFNLVLHMTDWGLSALAENAGRA